MINTDRIVPITKTDLLSVIGIILGIAGTSYTIKKSADVEGNFAITGSGDIGNIIANQPVVSLDFKTGVTAATCYFVADANYTGFKVAGTAVTTSGATIVKDGATIFEAVLSGGGVTLTAISPIVS